MPETYESHAKGIRILPGQWRPHHPFEQIAWVSPSWPCQDYIWLDFPEAVFTDAGLLFLSHISPRFPVVFPGLPKVPWRERENGIRFDRSLPNGVSFGGSLSRTEERVVEMRLSLHNGCERPLRNIKLQVCAYMRAVRELADHTMDNKYVHVPDRGWVRFEEAASASEARGRYRLGWRDGPSSADWPVIATVSNPPGRIAAMTWYGSTYSLIGNPAHPCMHADPFFPDLGPFEGACIRGELLFFEGTLDGFAEWFSRRGQGCG